MLSGVQTLWLDADSGVSAGQAKAAESTEFGTVDEDFTAYGFLKHRHTPEMEQAIGAQLLFTPHLAPMNRGSWRPATRVPLGPGAAPLEVLADAYRPGSPLSLFPSGCPRPRRRSAPIPLTLRPDLTKGRAGRWPCAPSTILVKGAAGQAVQCANAVMGWPETTGLPLAGLAP